MVGWHHRLNGHEFEQTLGVGGGQTGMVCCGPWGRKEADTTERRNSKVMTPLNNTAAENQCGLKWDLELCAK